MALVVSWWRGYSEALRCIVIHPGKVGILVTCWYAPIERPTIAPMNLAKKEMKCHQVWKIHATYTTSRLQFLLSCMTKYFAWTTNSRGTHRHGLGYAILSNGGIFIIITLWLSKQEFPIISRTCFQIERQTATWKDTTWLQYNFFCLGMQQIVWLILNPVQSTTLPKGQAPPPVEESQSQFLTTSRVSSLLWPLIIFDSRQSIRRSLVIVMWSNKKGAGAFPPLSQLSHSLVVFQC